MNAHSITQMLRICPSGTLKPETYKDEKTNKRYEC